jgi:hypothetical protein
MIVLVEPNHPHLLPLVEHSIVGLPHHFGKLLQGGFSFLQADSGFTLCTAQVRQIVTLNICVIFVIGISGNGGNYDILATSVFCGSAAGRNCFDGRLMGGLPQAPEVGEGGGFQHEDVGRLSGLVPGGPGGTLHAPGDDGQCPGNSCWGNICDSP